MRLQQQQRLREVGRLRIEATVETQGALAHFYEASHRLIALEMEEDSLNAILGIDP